MTNQFSSEDPNALRANTVQILRDSATPEHREAILALLATEAELRAALDDLCVPTLASAARDKLTAAGVWCGLDEQGFRTVWLRRSAPRGELEAYETEVSNRIRAKLQQGSTPIVQDIYRRAVAAIEGAMFDVDPAHVAIAERFGLPADSAAPPMLPALRAAVAELREGIARDVSLVNHSNARERLSHFTGPL